MPEVLGRCKSVPCDFIEFKEIPGAFQVVSQAFYGVSGDPLLADFSGVPRGFKESLGRSWGVPRNFRGVQRVSGAFYGVCGSQ